jgi:hypothetical protein
MDEAAQVTDLAELEGEPTWRADVLFDRTAENERRPGPWQWPTGVITSLLAIVVIGRIVRHIAHRPAR